MTQRGTAAGEIGAGATEGTAGASGSERKEVKLEYLPLDLSSFQSTTDFVRAFKEKNLPLHILVNNAGIAFPPYSELLVFAEAKISAPSFL